MDCSDIQLWCRYFQLIAFFIIVSLNKEGKLEFDKLQLVWVVYSMQCAAFVTRINTLHNSGHCPYFYPLKTPENL